MDDAAGCIAYLLIAAAVIAAVAFIVFLIAQIAAIVAAVMGGAGIAYGGGMACKNYGQAFKRNVIESNQA